MNHESGHPCDSSSANKRLIFLKQMLISDHIIIFKGFIFYSQVIHLHPCDSFFNRICETCIFPKKVCPTIIRWPLLARGSKAAGVSLIAFFNNWRSCCSAIRLCFYVLEGPNTLGSAPPDPLLEIRLFTKNRFVFKLVFKA